MTQPARYPASKTSLRLTWLAKQHVRLPSASTQAVLHNKLWKRHSYSGPATELRQMAEPLISVYLTGPALSYTNRALRLRAGLKLSVPCFPCWSDRTSRGLDERSASQHIFQTYDIHHRWSATSAGVRQSVDTDDSHAGYTTYCLAEWCGPLQ